MKTVQRMGKIRLAGHFAYVTTALEGHQVGLMPLDSGVVLVWFYDLLLGKFIPGVEDSVQPIDQEMCSHVLPRVSPPALGTQHVETKEPSSQPPASEG